MIGNLSSKCERCTMYCFMWGGQKVKGQGHWDRNVKIVVGAYLREKCINSREYKTVITPTLCCTFCRIQCGRQRDARCLLCDITRRQYSSGSTAVCWSMRTPCVHSTMTDRPWLEPRTVWPKATVVSACGWVSSFLTAHQHKLAI